MPRNESMFRGVERGIIQAAAKAFKGLIIFSDWEGNIDEVFGHSPGKRFPLVFG